MGEGFVSPEGLIRRSGRLYNPVQGVLDGPSISSKSPTRDGPHGDVSRQHYRRGLCLVPPEPGSEMTELRPTRSCPRGGRLVLPGERSGGIFYTIKSLGSEVGFVGRRRRTPPGVQYCSDTGMGTVRESSLL